jgi:hypothetical protein
VLVFYFERGSGLDGGAGHVDRGLPAARPGGGRVERVRAFPLELARARACGARVCGAHTRHACARSSITHSSMAAICAAYGAARDHPATTRASAACRTRSSRTAGLAAAA